MLPSTLITAEPTNPSGTSLPGAPFLLFGVGPRRKLLYANSALYDALTKEPLMRWEGARAQVSPSDFQVELTTPEGDWARLFEDERGVWYEDTTGRRPLTTSPVALPDFRGHPHALLLRALLHEMLVNIVEHAPLPNLLVYKRPWYRDAAMVGMVLEKTGHLALIRPWLETLRAPFDLNNAGHREPDNLGQVLYLASLVASASQPIVKTVLEALPEFVQGDHIVGLSDFAEHPVYQTKWLKFGLGKLGLPDPYRIPEVADSYSALFWMAYRDHHVAVPPFSEELGRLYPYLAWAEAHFYDAAPPLHLAGTGAPLTWEAEASQADYTGMSQVGSALVDGRFSAPHTWHAAEMFLYLLERTEA